MNRTVIRILSALIPLLTVPALHAQQAVHDLDITFDLTENGGIVVEESWDIDTGTGITEWYLVRENLGDIGITSLYVVDNDSNDYTFEDPWDVDRTMEQKAYKCGIVHKKNGVELCWGISSYGHHVYHAIYGMTHAVKSLNDYDMLHIQAVSPGLSTPPEHVRLTVQSEYFQMDTLNTRVWAFGYEGEAHVQDGKAVFESDGKLGKEDSVIILMRFDKGLMTPKSVQERDFQEALDIALEDSDYLMSSDQEDDPIASGIAYFFTTLIFFFIGRRIWKVLFPSKYSMFKGLKKKDIVWYRDIPMDGNLLAADQMLSDTYIPIKDRNLPMSMILRMIYQGHLDVSRELEGPAKLSFKSSREEVQKMGPCYAELYEMMRTAAGENQILEKTEFSKWIHNHEHEAYQWTESVTTAARNYLKNNELLEKNNVMAYTRKGTEAAKQLLGLKKFLEEFTLSDQREAFEVKLWKEYLVYAGLFGIADKVAKQLKDIDPALFRQNIPYFSDNLDSTLALVNTLSVLVNTSSKAFDDRLRAHMYSSSSGSSYSRSSGGGGRSSHSGGRGYSGGGRGGGGR